MKSYFDVAIFFFWTIIEFINIYLIAGEFLYLEKKKPTIRHIFFNVFVFWVLWCVFVVATIKDNRILIGLLYVPLLLKSLIIVSLFYKIKRKIVFIVFFFVTISSSLAGNIGLLLKTIRYHKFASNSFAMELLASTFFLIVFLSLLLIKKKFDMNIIFSNLGYIDYVLFIVITYSVSMIEIGMFRSVKYSNAARTVAVIAYISVAFLIFRSIVTIVRKSHLEDINQLLEKQMKQTTEYYNELVEKEKDTRKFRHDIRNLLIGLYSLIRENKNDKALGYIDELQEMTSHGSSKYNSGNFIADAILTAKSHRSEKDAIKIELNGLMPSDKIADSDIVIILSNLLDNAIEACEKLEGTKTIVINSVLKKNIWVLLITNPSEKVNIKNSNSIKTSKAEKDIHGFGLSNINKVAKKYNGDFSLEYNEGIFQSKVQLMLQ